MKRKKISRWIDENGHNCALADDGSEWCWSSDGSGWVPYYACEGNLPDAPDPQPAPVAPAFAVGDVVTVVEKTTGILADRGKTLSQITGADGQTLGYFDNENIEAATPAEIEAFERAEKAKGEIHGK